MIAMQSSLLLKNRNSEVMKMYFYARNFSAINIHMLKTYLFYFILRMVLYAPHFSLQSKNHYESIVARQVTKITNNHSLFSINTHAHRHSRKYHRIHISLQSTESKDRKIAAGYFSKVQTIDLN